MWIQFYLIEDLLNDLEGPIQSQGKVGSMKTLIFTETWKGNMPYDILTLNFRSFSTEIFVCEILLFQI